MTDILKLRKESKAKRPSKFRRQDIHKKPRLSDVWRKPRGIQSKQRLQLKGHTPIVKTGYGTPSNVKNLDKSGLIPVLVATTKELGSIDTKTQGVVISSKVGQKKKIEIIKLALEKNITILNLKNPSGFIESVEKKFQMKKKEKTERNIAKEKKKEDLEKKAKEKEKKEQEENSSKEENKTEDSDQNDKEKKEKKELDKVLTTKEM